MTGAAFYWLLFPGLATIFAGSLAVGWLERKIRARMEYRVGPPPLQPLYDWMKLGTKHRPPGSATSKWRCTLFLSIGLAAAYGFSMLVWQSVFFPSKGFRGDFFAAFLLFVSASLFPALGVAGSRSRSGAIAADNAQKGRRGL